ncbi:DUF1392 domain-containing protein [Nostoc sp. CHAB 5715]|nr:DUF1392 domain-containing protein [Nostoc sp. CHAB 5715]
MSPPWGKRIPPLLVSLLERNGTKIRKIVEAARVQRSGGAGEKEEVSGIGWKK